MVEGKEANKEAAQGMSGSTPSLYQTQNIVADDTSKD